MFNDYTFQIVVIGCSILGLSCGLIGSFSFLRNESLLGDALAHAALPGVCTTFLITQTKATGILLLGALLVGILCIFLIDIIKKYTKIKFDSILALILSSFFGLGLVQLSYIGKLEGQEKTGLDKFIFGQASSMLKSDVYMLVFVASLVILLLIAFWKEFKIVSFDKDYADSIGISSRFYSTLLSIFTVICIIIGIQTVGVILISSLLIAPSVAARQLTDKLIVMVILSGIFGIIACMIGVIMSSSISKLPTGPIIAVLVSIIAFISILFAPLHGVLMQKNGDKVNGII